MAKILWVSATFIVAVAMMAADLSERHVLLQHGRAINGTKAGVDREDDLWFWNEGERSVVRISRDGALITSAPLPPAASVDADSRRGIAILSEAGDEVQVVSWVGQVLKTFPLPEPAGDIAWLTGSLAAVTPQVSDHRIAIWDT